MAGESAVLIGARIRGAREERGWTRRELTRRIDGLADPNDLYRWEKGQHRPRDDALAAIARALELPVSFFFDDRPSRTPEPFPSNGGVGVPEMTAQLAELTQAVRNAPAPAEPDLTPILEQLERIETTLGVMRTENEARVAEVRQQISEALAPTQEPRKRRRG